VRTKPTPALNNSATKDIKLRSVKKTYPQNWTLYNMSQTKEKMLFLKILNDAVNYLNIDYAYKGDGRPHYPLEDMIKCCCIKVFNNFSSRRTVCELQLANALGYIPKIPHFNSINNYMNNPELTPYLHKLYKLLALPLADTESNFGIDATGFSTANKKKWLDARLVQKEKRNYKKLHIVSGLRTNIIVSADISEGSVHDTNLFEDLVKKASMNFKIRELCADSGYLSRENCTIVREIGATPYILPKSNVRFKNIVTHGYTAWRDMLRMWQDNEASFREHYHKRSNVESTFSAMKRKFLPYVRSKTDLAQTNEILCKVICHNIAVLVNSLFELDIDISFGN
jgi:transposase